MKRFAVQIILTWVIYGIAVSGGMSPSLLTCMLSSLAALAFIEASVASAEGGGNERSDDA